MAVYGQLTTQRPTNAGTVAGETNLDSINNMYDFHLNNLVTQLPDGWDTYYLEKPSRRSIAIKNSVDLVDADPIAICVRSTSDTFLAALAMVRRYLNNQRLMDASDVEFNVERVGEDITAVGESVYGIEPDITYTQTVPIGSIYDNVGLDLFDVALNDNNVLQEQQSFTETLDPRWITGAGAYNIRDKFGTYLPRDIQSGFLMKGDMEEIFSFSQAQNIYTDYYGQERDFYGVGEVFSKSLEKVTGIEDSLTQIMSQGNAVNSTIANNSSILGNTQQIMGSPQYAPSLRTSVARYQNRNVQTRSYSGGNSQQFFSEEEMNNKNMGLTSIRSVFSDFSLSTSLQSLTIPTVGTDGISSRGVLVNRTLPLDFDGTKAIAGNVLTDGFDNLLNVSVQKLIDKTGVSKTLSYNENKVRNIKTDNTSIDGSFKFRQSSLSTVSRNRISSYITSTGITDPLLSPATTVTIHNTSIDFRLNVRQGSLGVETFDDEGYDGWFLGQATGILLENLDNDIGSSSYDKGVTFIEGNIETFDIGWTEGISPYSREGEAVAFKEDLTDQVTGSATNFRTSYSYVRGTLEVFLNGVAQISATTFTETTEKTFTTTFTPLVGDFLEVRYDRFYDSPKTVGTMDY